MILSLKLYIIRCEFCSSHLDSILFHFKNKGIHRLLTVYSILRYHRISLSCYRRQSKSKTECRTVQALWCSSQETLPPKFMLILINGINNVIETRHIVIKQEKDIAQCSISTLLIKITYKSFLESLYCKLLAQVIDLSNVVADRSVPSKTFKLSTGKSAGILLFHEKPVINYFGNNTIIKYMI